MPLRNEGLSHHVTCGADSFYVSCSDGSLNRLSSFSVGSVGSKDCRADGCWIARILFTTELSARCPLKGAGLRKSLNEPTEMFQPLMKLPVVSFDPSDQNGFSRVLPAPLGTRDVSPTWPRSPRPMRTLDARKFPGGFRFATILPSATSGYLSPLSRCDLPDSSDRTASSAHACGLCRSRRDLRR